MTKRRQATVTPGPRVLLSDICACAPSVDNKKKRKIRATHGFPGVPFSSSDIFPHSPPKGITELLSYSYCLLYRIFQYLGTTSFFFWRNRSRQKKKKKIESTFFFAFQYFGSLKFGWQMVSHLYKNSAWKMRNAKFLSSYKKKRGVCVCCRKRCHLQTSNFLFSLISIYSANDKTFLLPEIINHIQPSFLLSQRHVLKYIYIHVFTFHKVNENMGCSFSFALNVPRHKYGILSN